jgi:hypothetical protein
MYPSSVGAIVVFLLVVTPGAGFELLWHRTRPRRSESTFIEVSRVLLTGVVFSGAAIATLMAARVVADGAAVDIVAFVREGTGYVERHAALILRSLAAVPILGLLYGIAAHDLLTPPAMRAIADESGWHTAFSRMAGSGSRAYLSVQLKDGMTLTGFSAGYSTDPDPAKRDLLLGAPLAIRSPGRQVATPLEDSWQILLVPGSEVSTIAVTYVGTTTPTPEPVGRRRAALAWVADRAWQSALTAALAVVLLLIVIEP